MGGAVSSGIDNNDLINNLCDSDYIRTKPIERVLRAVDRGEYILPEFRMNAYKDQAWRANRLHLSAPCIYSEVLEALVLKPGISFLNLGSGTGYLSTMVGLLLGSEGLNHGIEFYEDVVQYAYKKLEEFKKYSGAIDEFDFCEPKFIIGNCLCLTNDRQYDRVYVGACPPEAFENYMKCLIRVGGILVMPYNDQLLQIKRTADSVWETSGLLSVSFAHLLNLPDQRLESINLTEQLTQGPKSLQVLCRIRIRGILRAGIEHDHPQLRTREHPSAKPRAAPKENHSGDGGKSPSTSKKDGGVHFPRRSGNSGTSGGRRPKTKVMVNGRNMQEMFYSAVLHHAKDRLFAAWSTDDDLSDDSNKPTLENKSTEEHDNTANETEEAHGSKDTIENRKNEDVEMEPVTKDNEATIQNNTRTKVDKSSKNKGGFKKTFSTSMNASSESHKKKLAPSKQEEKNECDSSNMDADDDDSDGVTPRQKNSKCRRISDRFRTSTDIVSSSTPTSSSVDDSSLSTSSTSSTDSSSTSTSSATTSGSSGGGAIRGDRVVATNIREALGVVAIAAETSSSSDEENNEKSIPIDYNERRMVTSPYTEHMIRKIDELPLPPILKDYLKMYKSLPVSNLHSST